MANQNIVSMKALLEAGVHFGHQTRRWNPKMAPYIYTERNGIYIIDLQKTVKKLEEAYNFVRQLSENGQSLLFVGTKKQAQEAIKDEALRCNMYYVNARWLGGMMTNFKTMRTRIDRLNQLKAMEGRRHLRYAAQEGSHQAPGRDREAGEVSGRREGNGRSCPALCSSWTPVRSATPSLSPHWASLLWPSLIPTAIPTRSITPSPATTTPSVPSS